MRLSLILSPLEGAEVKQFREGEVRSVVCDSRKCGPGSLFCALKGARLDGSAFADDAESRGAVAVLTEQPQPLTSLPQIIVNDARAAMRSVSWAVYGEDASRLALIGVTGTNGKTTVVFLIREMLAEGGRPSGLVSTLGVDTSEGLKKTSMTTPETCELLEALSRVRRAGLACAVIEVSSHALELGRIEGLDFSAAVFTNLTRDHLDFHGSMENYFRAKARLFERLGPEAVAVLNAEDERARELAGLTRARVLTAGLSEGCDLRVRPAGGEVTIRTRDGSARASWKFPGTHNLLNLATAAGAAHALGVGLEEIARAAGRFQGLPGRLEEVRSGAPFRVFVDYAHTPDALRAALTALRPLALGRLVIVFGCGGDRDRTKRPIMGRLADELADEIVITSDNPRSESPIKIIEEIAAGLPHGRASRIEPDRARAIELAIASAHEGDVVLLAGKGHETEQLVGERRVPFDDRLKAAEVLGKLGYVEAGRAR